MSDTKVRPNGPPNTEETDLPKKAGSPLDNESLPPGTLRNPSDASNASESRPDASESHKLPPEQTSLQPQDTSRGASLECGLLSLKRPMLLCDRELHWYVAQIVRPQLAHLRDTLEVCGNLLRHNLPDSTHGPPITLPISAGALGALLGVLTRDGPSVTKMEIQVGDKRLARVAKTLRLVQPLPLAQVAAAAASVDDALAELAQARALFAPGSRAPHAQLVSQLRALFAAIGAAKVSLQLPTDPALVFPQHVTQPGSFAPNCGLRLAADVYVSQAEVCLDIKALSQVTEKPWCEIDAKGKLYADRVRDEMSAGRTPEIEHTGWRLTRRPAEDYVARCVTYGGHVVMVDRKVEVLSADPVLVSTFTKLDSVEYVVGAFMANIETLTRGEGSEK